MQIPCWLWVSLLVFGTLGARIHSAPDDSGAAQLTSAEGIPASGQTSTRTSEKASPQTTPAHPGESVRSNISIYNLRDHSVHVVFTAPYLIEAPNWSRDGKFLLVNTKGSLYRLYLGNHPASLEKLSLPAELRANNDHGLSPNGEFLALSAIQANAKGSRVYLAPADGSKPHLLVSETPSYFHSWSPDGKDLAFVGERQGNFDLYRISSDGAKTERLTYDKGYDDGPDYSPDGKWIYFNSDRSGGWDIWRLPTASSAGDSEAQHITSDELEDWFPHPSPDGKWIVFISFPKGTAGHNTKTMVQLRMLRVRNDEVEPGPPRVLANFFGGQGTINVNSWSPDSSQFAFVSYAPLAP